MRSPESPPQRFDLLKVDSDKLNSDFLSSVELNFKNELREITSKN